MATKPIIKTMAPFDAGQSYTLSFVWKGNMAYNNRLVIYDSDTQYIVYDHTYPTNYYKLTHEIPPNTLVNGKKYQAQIQVIDKDGIISEPSDKNTFWVLASPTFYIEGLSSTGENEVDASSYIANIYFSQENNDKLDTCQFFLYSSVKELLDSSSLLQGDTKSSYTFRSLENDTNYYIRATGYTKKNIPLDTGYILISVHYTDPSFYSRMYASVNRVIGTVDYHTNIVNIESDQGSSAYEYDDGCVDFTGCNPNATLVIATDSALNPQVKVEYLDINGGYNYVVGNGSVTVSSYSQVDKIEIHGKTRMINSPTVSLYNYLHGSYEYIPQINLSIGDTVIQNVTSSLPMRELPINNTMDKFILESTGKRTFYRSVGEYDITSKLTPSKTESKTNNLGHNIFITYFDIDGRKNDGASNLVCNDVPVNNERTCVFLTSDGALGLQFDETETLVTNLSSAMTWLQSHPLKVLYPLARTEVIPLEPIVMPSMKNVNSVRYSTNFVIPADNATFSLRMKEAFKTSEIMRVQKDDKITFIVSSMIYDDGTLRYKLQVFGPFSDYIIYSEPLVFKRWDFVTLHIRRINGLYGMTVFITEVDPNALHNVWYMTSTPHDNTQDKDLWFDLNYPITYVDKDTAVKYYQDEKPTGAEPYKTLWIGG